MARSRPRLFSLDRRRVISIPLCRIHHGIVVVIWTGGEAKAPEDVLRDHLDAARPAVRSARVGRYRAVLVQKFCVIVKVETASPFTRSSAALGLKLPGSGCGPRWTSSRKTIVSPATPSPFTSVAVAVSVTVSLQVPRLWGLASG